VLQRRRASRPAPEVAGALAALAVLAASTAASAAPPALNLYSLLSRADLAAELEARHAAPGDLGARLERLTRGLLAAPYVLSPLGEGAGPDPDPRFRVDAFDCTTFVETALALLACDELDRVEAVLDRIRYEGGAPDFARRRHLMTTQWIPGLVAEGRLEDVTRPIGGEATRQVVLELDDARWARRRVARALALERIPSGTFALDYLPLDVALARLEDIPPATLINVVRASAPGAPDVITHQGLVVTRPGEAERLVRHASPVAKRVIDEPLRRMLTRYQRPRRWPIVGVHLMRIVPPR
jgi:hypothetical protein